MKSAIDKGPLSGRVMITRAGIFFVAPFVYYVGMGLIAREPIPWAKAAAFGGVTAVGMFLRDVYRNAAARRQGGV